MKQERHCGGTQGGRPVPLDFHKNDFIYVFFVIFGGLYFTMNVLLSQLEIVLFTVLRFFFKFVCMSTTYFSKKLLLICLLRKFL